MLYTAIHMGFYPCVVHMILYFRHDTLDEGFPDAPLLSELMTTEEYLTHSKPLL